MAKKTKQTLRANPTWLNLILDPEGPTWVGYNKDIIWFKSELENFLRSTLLPGLDSSLDSEGQPNLFEPENSGASFCDIINGA